MKSDDIFNHEIVCILRTLERAPVTMTTILEEAKKNGYMKPENALKLHHTYGISAKFIYLLCHSHGIYVPICCFSRMIENELEQLAKSKLL